MVGSYGVGNVLHQDSLTRLWLSHNQCTLALTDRSKQVDNTHRRIRRCTVATECELLIGEEWRQVLKSHTVAHLLRQTSVDGVHRVHGEVFLVVMWRTNGTIYHIARLQSVALNLLRTYVDIVGRRQVVIVARAQETVTVLQQFQYAVACNQVVEIIFFATTRCVVCSAFSSNYRLLSLCYRTVKDVERRNGGTVLNGQVDYGNEVCTVARITFPYAVQRGNVLLLCVHLFLQLVQ